MTEDFIAIVLFDSIPSLSAEKLASAAQELEPGTSLDVRPDGNEPGEFAVRSGDVRMRLAAVNGQMPEEATISSIGMADIPSQDAQRLLQHRARVIMTCNGSIPITAIEQMIVAFKLGTALCREGGWALCLPSSGLCILADELASLTELNQAGPRVWGVDESEADLPGYVKYSLWESLRREAHPANILVGFVPAEVENGTWFFSAGHSLFGLPEIIFSDGTLDDFQTVRDLFRFIFTYFYQRPEQMKPGEIVRTNDSALTITLQALPPKHSELQSPTGTLKILVMDTAGPDTVWE